MDTPAIPDIITIVGSSYFQPIADLCESMLDVPIPEHGNAGGYRENGYAAALVLLLVAVLESYVSRLRFKRVNEITAPMKMNVPDLLIHLFPDLPNKEHLVETFLLRNVVVHNHVWHLDVSEPEGESKTIQSPIDLGFDVNKCYRTAVDHATRRTCQLGFPADPTAVNRYDVKKVFEIVWRTLTFMNAKDYSHTPLPFHIVAFRKKRIPFESLPTHIE